MEAGQERNRRNETPMAQEYYYGQMSREEQEAYRGMFAGFCEIASEISVRRLDNRQAVPTFSSGSGWIIRRFFMWRVFSTGL